ncbi:unnamed protein product, partial [Gulo gulo]
ERRSVGRGVCWLWSRPEDRARPLASFALSPCLPFRPSVSFSRIQLCGGRGVAIRRQCGVKKFISHGCIHERTFKGQGGSRGCC